MTVRIPWDRYEVALLFNAYERVDGGSDINTEAEKLSVTLRALAVCRGISIDDTYRNVNGMKMQLANVQYLFTGGQKGLSGASAMIRQMYELYKANRTVYHAILKEAHQMTEKEDMSVEDAFFAYAEDKIGYSPQMLTEYLREATDYCHLKTPLLGMTDVRAVRVALQKVSEGKLLRFKYGKEAQNIRNVVQLYYTFIKSYWASKKEDITQPVSVMENPIENPIIEQVHPQAADETIAEDIVNGSKSPMSAEGGLSAEKKVLQQDIPMDEDKRKLLVDFSQDNSYFFTKPIAYTYKGKVYAAKSWSRLYVEICGLLFSDYHDAFMGIINGDIPGYNALAFADEQHKNGMRAARCFTPGFYLESNLSATTIVRKLRGLYQLFNLGDDLRISYIIIGDTEIDEVSEESDEEWLIHELRTREIPYVDNRSADGCLWIVSDMSIPILMSEAAERGYRFRIKQDGCRAFPNRPVIWTKDQPETPSKIKPVHPADGGTTSLDTFRRYLHEEKGFAERTAGNYWTSIRMIEAYIQRNNLDFSLLNTDAAGAQRIFDLLMDRPDFEQINIQRHRQFSAALIQYIAFLRHGGAIVSEVTDTGEFSVMQGNR